MNFSSKADKIIKIIGYSNTRLARVCGIDPSLVSRFRTGARTPRPESAQLRLFSGGIASCALENGLWDTLRTVCQLSEALSPEEAVRDYLTRDSPDVPAKEQTGRSGDESVGIFGTKLSSAMNMLDISNIRLARALNVDTSLVSRFRSGQRVPPRSGQLLRSLCLYLYKVVTSKGTYEASENFEQLTGVNTRLGEAEFIRCISVWLTDSGGVQSNGTMISFLERLDNLRSLNIPEQSALFPICSEDKTDKAYYGTEGIRAAAVRFLSTVITSCAEEIKLYSDQNLTWMTEDTSFTRQWGQLMFGVLKNRTRIKIIHNVDRSLPEMLAGIAKWLPLYMSGGVEGYFSRQPVGDRFSHTLFVSAETAAVSAFMAAGGEDKAEYLYTVDKQRLSCLEAQFDILMQSSRPLLRVYRNTTAEEYELFLNELSSYRGETKRLMLSPPVYTLPASLLRKMLERSGADKEEADRILSAHKRLQERFMDRLSEASITDYLYFADREAVESGRAVLNLSDVMSERVITYTMDEYREHIKSLVPLLDGGGYNIIPLPESPFSNIQITVKEGFGAVVQKSDPPVTVFRFGHPLMCKALSEYITAIGKTYENTLLNKMDISNYLLNRYMT